MNKILITALLLLVCQLSWAQDEFFNELEFRADVFENEKWTLRITPSWKHIYDEVGWRRLGLGFTAIRKLNNWHLLGGLYNSYTFNKEIDNLYELRPWAGIGLYTPISERILFYQKAKAEWRNLFISGEDTKNENYGRLRYRMDLHFLLSENEEKNTEWKLKTSAEWYFLKDPASGERFPNSREFGLKFVHKFKNNHEIGFGYKIESFYEAVHHEGGNGHIFLLEYAL